MTQHSPGRNPLLTLFATMTTVTKSDQALQALEAGEKGENVIKAVLEANGLSFTHNKKLKEFSLCDTQPDFTITTKDGKKIVVEVRTQNTTGSAREKNAFLMQKLSLINSQLGYETFLLVSGSHLTNWMANCPIIQATATSLPHVQVIDASIFVELVNQGLIK